MEQPHENAPERAADFNCRYVPEFVLLDSRGPHPGTLVASLGCLGALVASVVVLAGRPGISRPPRAETFTGILVPHARLWLPDNPLPTTSPEHPAPPPEVAERAEPFKELHQPPAPIRAAKDTAGTDPPAVLPRPELSFLPLPRNDILPGALKLMPLGPTTSRAAEGSSNPAPQALGTVPLRQLLERQDELALRLATLPANQRRAMPQVSIRVNGEWLEALPLTQEKLYFSLTTPRADTRVLAYLPATRTFIWERAQGPLWQVRDTERVPALVALRAAAAGRLGMPPELVNLYTWHPPLFESALRMFVLGRMEQMGAPLGPRDVVTVRVASGPGGFVMNIEPVRAVQQLTR